MIILSSNAVNSFFRTPPFSSDEESEEEETETEEEPPKHQRGKSQQTILNQGVPVQTKPSKAIPVLARQAAVRHPFSTSPQPTTVSDPRVTRTVVTKLASDDEEEDWSDVSELQEIDSRQFHSSKDQNGNVDNRSFPKGKRHSLYFIKF